MVPLLPLRDGVRALPISFFRQSMPSFYMNAPDCICSPGRLPLGAFCTGRDDQAVAFRLARSAISIHAPRVGRDAGWAIRCIHYSISIHAPRAGCDHMAAAFSSVCAAFQSTHPVRGATTILGVGFLKVLISIHAPRAGCDNRDSQPKVVLQISIHAPRAGCDSIQVVVTLRINQFQSTHPVRGATRGSVSSPARSGFQSTHPVRGATGIRRRRVLRALFQSTHPVRGATAQNGNCPCCKQYFNPRTPCGVRLTSTHTPLVPSNFNPRTPCGVRL